MKVARPSVANGFSLISAVLSFLPLSCCVFPVAFSFLGASGLAFSMALTPYRPYFVALTLISLGAGFYFTYRPVKEDCSPGTACAVPKYRRSRIITLWIITLVTLALLGFPYLVPYLPIG